MPRGPEVDFSTIRTVEGRALHRRRNELNMSQSEAARRMGYDPSVLNRHEQGITKPGKKAQVKISEVFGIPFDELIEREKELEGVGPYGQIRDLKSQINTLTLEIELLRQENQTLRERLDIEDSADIFVHTSSLQGK